MTQEGRVTENGITYRFSSAWIQELESEEHWRLYWRQQKLMEGRIHGGDSILEIGVGSGFTANYLRSRGFHVTTVDIDRDKRPDIVANIVTFEPEQVFDHILAFEVFEHIPFEKFVDVVGRLTAKPPRYFFVSVPEYKRVVATIECQLPKLGRHSLSLALPKRDFGGSYHFWELGHRGINEQKLADVFYTHGFQLEYSDRFSCRQFFAFRGRGTDRDG